MSRERVSREERMSQIQEKLEAGVREIFDSEKYKDYISTMAKFPHYSINNCILIVSQCPEASHVCGYKKWQTDFNRVVNRNEHGIMIIAPMTYKADVEEAVFDSENHPVLDSNGKQVTETVTREFQGFRPAYVFDVSQTSGDPLPTLATMLSGGVEDFENMKDILIAISPVPISFEKITGGANGYFSPATQSIVVKEGMSELQTIKTMIHEIAHATLGHGGKDDKWDRETKEVQAESVAYWVMQMVGLDTSDYSFGYISGWSKDREVTELKENLDLIKTTADKISADLERELSKSIEQTEDLKPGVEQVEQAKRKKVR
ncbi:ImmA/IrrE family metallo-endopeptidase [bacterium]|nr:ImmA/IrrE family metallo-endopeptidase [bacterium]